MMKQAHIFYSGMVQGVGFRYMTVRFASDFPLTGRVKNLDDGRVEVLVEGYLEDIEKLCQRLNDHFKGYIRDQKIDWREPQSQFNDFKITY